MLVRDSVLWFFGVTEPVYSMGLPNGWLPKPDTFRSYEEQRRLRDRSGYRRIQAPLLCRPAGLRLFARHSGAVARDVTRVRIWSDERFEPEDRLKLELIVGGEASPKFFAEVAWIDAQAASSPARFDVGLRVERIDRRTAEVLRSVLR